ncbi:hypothetical protein [Paenibacillus tyrfis]|uniref:hypothetical protein n=1 Tax=Paenibacillus tyrfis TaxID=1501230 RepID=UPI000B594019|nr:hypothetical protein [Paenibacillus tyrfis]
MSQTKRRSPEERLAELNKKMEQLKAQKQRVRAQLNQKERKDRTRRLIQVGAIFEKQFPMIAEWELGKVSQLASELDKLARQYRERNAVKREGDTQ